MPTLTPTTADAFYGPDAHQRYDHYKHPIRDQGGNPVVILRHGGGWRSKDKRLTSIDTDELNTLAFALLSDTEVHFDVISIETRQARWDSPVTTAAFGYSEASTVPTYYPEAWRDFQRAILHVKVASKDLGINPNKVIVGGTSAGACIALWTQLVPPMVAGPTNEGATVSGGQFQASVNVRQTSAKTSQRFDSTALGVWYLQGLPDIRKVGTTESVATTYWDSIFNSANATSAAAIPAAAREAVSAIALIEKGARVPKVYAAYAPTKKRFTGAAYTASSGVIFKTSEFTSGYAARQAGDTIVIGTPTGTYTTEVLTRVGNDSITVAANAAGTSDATVSGEITFSKPYGSGTRDVHDEEQGNNLRRACVAAGGDCAMELYGSFTAGKSVAWMKGLVR